MLPKRRTPGEHVHSILTPARQRDAPGADGGDAWRWKERCVPMQTMPDPDAPSPAPAADLLPLADPRRPRRPLIATLRAPWARVLTTTLIVLAALAYIFGRTLPGGLGDLSAHLFAPTPTRVAAATVTPTAMPIIPTPLPASGLLGPPPADCSSAVSLVSIIDQPAGFRRSVHMIGRAPVPIPE